MFEKCCQIRLEKLLLIGFVVLGIAGWSIFKIVDRQRRAAIHAEYSDSIVVPKYNKLSFDTRIVKPQIEIGIGLKTNIENNRKIRSNSTNNSSSKDDKLISVVSTNYKMANKASVVYAKTRKPLSQKTKPKQPKPDWYIDSMPKAQRDYLLSVRNKKISWLNAFFARYRAPLKANVYDFVYASEFYGIDYRLLPAISIVESGGGKHLFKSYNPFGWGRHGYKSFKHAIWDVSRGMSIYYYRLGRRSPESIGRLYNPVTSDHWARKVRYLMNLMPKY